MPYRTTIRAVRKCFVSLLFFALGSLDAQSIYSRHQLLDRALSSAADIGDDLILKRTLYGTLRPDEISIEQADEMVAASQRRFDRIKDLVDQVKPLIEQGIYARNELTPILEELDYRRRTLTLAESRARFLREIAEMARAEQSFDTQHEDDLGPKPIQERYDGNGLFTPNLMRDVVLSYEKQFAKPLPISANGETAVHRAMGYDHRGRIDVGLSPDTPEGIWLRQYLESKKIPYYAFRTAIPGKATAAHIHIGPPSNRLRAAD